MANPINKRKRTQYAIISKGISSPNDISITIPTGSSIIVAMIATIKVFLLK